VAEHRARVGVVVVDYRDPQGTARVVGSLSDLPEAEIVVVSTGPEKYNAGTGIRVIHLPSNPGFGAAVNRGAESLGPNVTHFLVSNTDISTSGMVVRTLWEEARRNGAAMLAPTIVGLDGLVEWEGGRIDFLRLKGVHERMGERPREGTMLIPTTFVTGAHVMIARAAYDMVGGMREDFFLYGEDADFSMRVQRAGQSAAVYTGVRVVHERSGSVGRSSPLQVYLMTRNNIRFFKEWSPTLVGRLLCWPAVPLRLAFQCGRRGDALWRLVPWIALGTWDARRASAFHSAKGRAARLLSRGGGTV
jgi:GT2 family glycosyltransferase